MIMLILSMIICFAAAKTSPSSVNEVAADFEFYECLSDENYDRSSNDTCDEPQWRTKPIKIPFKDIKSGATTINLDLTGIDADKKLNYDSPALSFEVEGSSVLEPLTYFKIRPDKGYGKEFELLEERDNTQFCSLEDKTSWTFDRAEKLDEESSVTIVLKINGNQICSYMEMIMKLLKQYWYLAIAGGLFLLVGLCCMCYCCSCSCCCCLFEMGAQKVWDDMELV